MSLIAVCASPRKKGNTEICLERVLAASAEAGLEGELVNLRDYDPRGCTACGACRTAKDGRCHGRDDGLNDVFARVYAADALVVGSPVYFGSPAPEALAFLHRLGYVARGQAENPLKGMIGAGVAVARRAGQNMTLAALEFTFGPLEMVRAGSTYWPMAFGKGVGEVTEDADAMHTLDTLGRNIADLTEKLRG